MSRSHPLPVYKNLANVCNKTFHNFFPPFPLTISTVMEAIKVGSTHRMNAGRRERGRVYELVSNDGVPT